MLDLAFRDFRVVIINMIEELNEIMFKKLKRDLMAVSHQKMSIKRQKLYKKEPNGNSEVQSTLSRIKNLLKGLTSRYELTE